LAQGGMGLGRIGGATPGKSIVGLCVVSCSSISAGNDNFPQLVTETTSYC